MPQQIDFIERESRVSNAPTLSSVVEIKEEHNTKLPLEIIDATKDKPVRRYNLAITFLGIQISLFLAALDSTIISTALTRIGSDFNNSSIVAWVATAYILTFDAFQPLFSKFSDIFGRKAILLFGLSMFLLGSLLCAVSTNIIMLIVCRAIAGIGGGGIFSMAFVIIADLTPLEKRGTYQGVVNAVFALSSVFGPLIGGSFTDYVTWRWSFYINLPIGAVGLVVIFFFLHLPVPQGSFKDKLKRIDYIGTCTVLAFATLFLLAMNFGGQLFPWVSAAVLVPLVLAALLVALLVFIETKVAEPLLPPRIFKNASVCATLCANWFFGMAFFSLVYYLPVYFQVVRGDTAMWSGIRLIPMQLLTAVFSSIAGVIISKIGFYKPFPVIGMALLTLCTGLVSLLDKDTPMHQIYGFTVIGGAGLGFMFSSAIIALQACAAPEDVAVTTGLGNFSRILGGALGVAISSAILNSSLTHDLPLSVPDAIAVQVLAASEYVRNGCPPEYVEPILTCYVDALRLIWHVMVAMAGIGFCMTLFIKSGTVFKERRSTETKEQDDTVENNVREETVAVQDTETNKQ